MRQSGYRFTRALTWEAAAELAGSDGTVLVASDMWDEGMAARLARSGVHVELADAGTARVWRQGTLSVIGDPGAGRTLVAFLAALGARLEGLRPLLVDLNTGWGGGDLSFYLALPQSPNWNTFLAGERLRDVAIAAGGVDVLQVPPVPLEVPRDAVERALREAREEYDLVVFDLPAHACPVRVDVFSASAQRAVWVADGRRSPPERISVLLNDRWGSLKKADVPYLGVLAGLEAPGGWCNLEKAKGIADKARRLLRGLFGRGCSSWLLPCS